MKTDPDLEWGQMAELALQHTADVLFADIGVELGETKVQIVLRRVGAEAEKTIYIYKYI